MKPFLSDLIAADEVEAMEGRQPPPPKRMKPPPLLFLIVAALVFAIGLLTGCADKPVTIGIEGQHGTYSYGSKSGLSIRAKIREEKSRRISPAEIERRWRK